MGSVFNFSKLFGGNFKWWLSRGPLKWINSIYWAIRYRTINRCDVINIKTLPPGYYDIDSRMLHACFVLLSEFVEDEKGIADIDDLKKCLETETDIDKRFILERQLTSHCEIKSIYDWWKGIYLKREEPEYKGPKNYDSEEFNAWSRLHSDWEKACSREDEANLIRLMKVRECLWT